MEPRPPRARPLRARAATGLILALSVLAERGGRATGDEEPVRYDRDVRPLLAARCFPCHGPDGARREASLRLDTPGGKEGAYRARGGAAALVPGSKEASEVWYRLTTEDDAERMPPADARQARLDSSELDLVRRWIEQGAQYEEYWAFVAPVRPELPAVSRSDWVRVPLDRFVLAKLEAAGLEPSPEADRRTLLRRLSLDLTGLPPTRAELRAFLADDSPDAYERVVDRLLASPRYGEHMARYWLDVVRYADTNGLHHDHFREMSPYRDWVIRAWNEGLPYDRFLTFQIAGDLYEEPTRDQLVASGFHRLHLVIDRGTMLPEESFARNVIDRVSAVGTAFLGLTLGCAVCHDHKYDPITQRDFYSLSAFFNNLDADPETGPPGGADFRRGLQPPYISFPTPEQTSRLEELRAALEAAGDESQRLQDELTEVEAGVAGAMVMRERAEVRQAHVLVRGQYDRPGDPVQRDTPAFLPPMAPRDGERTRMDLARWLVSPGNPLTARVAVNRLWQQLFGVGIVETSEDLGTQGEWPSHRELLDHLAVSFVESGWDAKALQRRIVLSSTYRQSSAADPRTFEKDPGNRLLARGSRYRLDAEVIRDQILATSGLLCTEMYGPSVKPPQPPGLWEAVTLPDSYPRTYVADEGDAIHRRSVYTFWKRSLPPPQMAILDAPTREACKARRERTNTPLQALLLMNEQEYLKAARHLALGLLAQSERTPSERLDVLFETLTARLPGDAVRATLLRSVQDLEELYAADPSLATELCAGAALPAGRSAPEVAAWTLLASTVYNLDVTRTRD